MAHADPLTDLIDQTIDGKYRVDALLGGGGMGAVFRAVHLGTDRIVALKVITPTLASDPQYLERFRREARACGRLRHPNIVDVTDFGVTRHGGRELAYLVMEFLDGCTLGDVLRQEPTPPLPWVIDTLEQTCAAVEQAHRHGILHRDLKPDNIWLEPNRRGGYSVKVLDFGLARLEPGSTAATVSAAMPGVLVDQTFAPAQTLAPDQTFAPEQTFAPDHTGTPASSGSATTFAGTPAYMSPEQAQGGEVTPRTDVYSLGVIAYRMLSGADPFTGTVSDVVNAHIHTTPPDVRALRSDVPQDAATLIMSAMAKDPAGRPASAGAFGNMLAAQLQPPGAFFQNALTLFVERLRPLLTVGGVCFLPALILSLLLAAWSAAHAVSPSVPAPSGLPIYIPLGVFAALLLAGTIGVGVLPVPVLQFIAAPLRPLDLQQLRVVYEPRVRAWLRSMMPVLWPQLLALLVMLVSIVVLSQLRPWVRSFPRSGRVLITFAFFVPYLLTMFWAIRRQRTGLTRGMFVGPAMLVEGLDFDSARARSVELSSKSGSLQQGVRQRFLIVMIVVSAAAGALFSGARLSAAAIAALSPLIAVIATVIMTFVGLVGALLYFAARRATGESMDRVLDDFERTTLPDTHWQRAHRDRVYDHLRTTGSRRSTTDQSDRPTATS